MKAPFLEAIRTHILVGDGAMGTQLQQAGLAPGAPGEVWNADAPEKVKAIQQRYRDAGSDLILTNTFGANASRLSLHGQESRVQELNRAGALVAREVMGPDRYVLGDIGPFGGFLEPIGDAAPEQVVAWFEEQVRGFVDGGVDAFIIETMTALEEIECAFQAIRKHSSLPIVASLAFDKSAQGGYRTMMGIAPGQAAAELKDLGVDVVGANCGTGLLISDYAAIVAEMREAAEGLPVIIQPNAGQPELTETGTVIYRETPEMMAAGVRALIDAGARIVGGCCGTTPDHIRLFSREVHALQ